MLWVTPHTSLKLPGRAARSRGRTFTGEFQSIHGILSGTFIAFCTPTEKKLLDNNSEDMG